MQTTPTGGGPREGHRPRDHAAIDDRIRHYTRDIIGGGAELIPVLLADVEISGDDASGYRLVRDDEIVADGVPRNVVGQLSTRGNAPAAAPAGISPEFGRLWELGLIFFADRHTQIDSRARITARHSILLKAKVKADVHIRGDFAIFDDVVIHERTVIEGPGVLRQTVVDPHSFLSRIYFIENSFIGQFVKCQAGVCADGAIVAAHAAIDGGTHPELYPLTSDGSVPALVDLGTGTWIGHHASLTAGARIGAGSVVAAFTHVDGSVGANRMVAGSPARAIPLDFRIRALTPEQARAAGARHGNTACEFPMYGNPNIGWSGMRALEIDFPEHGHPAGECSDALLEFQRGAFETTFRFLLPGYRCSVTYRSGDTVRFRLDLDRPVGPSSTLRAETMVTAGTRPPTAEPDELEQRLLALIPPGGLSAGELVAKLNEVARIEGLDLPDQLQESICRLSQKGALSPSLIPSLFSPFPTCRLLERVIRRPDEFPELPPFRARTESAAPESGDADARTDEDARKRIRRVIAEMLDTPDAGVPDDLMLAGLSSLHYVELLLRVENEFDMELSSAALEDLPITVSGIANLVRRGHGGDRRRIPRQRPGQHAAAARPLPDIDLAEWAAGDIAAVIGRHIQSPPTPWIFKFLRSDRPNDYDYLTWGELGRRAGAARRSLELAGVRPGDVVTLILPQSASLVAHWVGCIFAGAVPSICASPNPKLTEAEFATWFGKVILQSRCRCIVSAPEATGAIRECLAKEKLKIPLLPPAAGVSDFDPRVPESHGPAPTLTAVLQHSSGTTGLKKAVALSHAQVLEQVWVLAEAMECSTADKIVSWLPLYHDMGLMGSFVFSLLWSVPTVLMSPFDWVRRPTLLLEQITEEHATLCWMPNFGFMHCANHVDDERAGNYDLSSLRCLLNCSEPVTEHAQQTFADKFRVAGFSASALTPSYAMAEYTFAVTLCAPGEPPRVLKVDRAVFTASGKVVPDDTPQGMPLVSCGTPLRNVELEIITPAGAPAGDGEVGEIRLRGPCMLSGYYRDTASTDAAMRDGFYHTGDLGFIWEGELYVTGRSKDLIIVGGQNLYPHDIEEALTRFPQIKPGRAAVFSVFDEQLATEELIIAAELRSDADINRTLEKEIRRAVIAQFDVTPRDVRLFAERVLPKSTSGKISRQRCREMYIEGHLGERGKER